MSRLRKRLLPSAAVFLSGPINIALVGSASAHVKWFCAYDVAGQPIGLEHVLNPDFVELTGLSIIGLMTGSILELPPLGPVILQVVDRVTGWVRHNFELIARAACAFFFIAIWGLGGVLLTPELKTDSTLIGVLQLGIAAGMLSRRTMPLSALGIFVLYGIAVWEYGVFHLADYPIFLGFATYLALTGTGKNFFGARPIDVMRWAAGITLMWASIEKWAYPEWAYPLFIIHPEMSMGFTPEYYMRAAGAVEFALAFSLIWTPLVRRAGAIMLIDIFVSAVGPFGKIDFIGHSLIVIALLGIAVDDSREQARLRDTALIPFAYLAALAIFLAVYYFGHAALFGTSVL